MNRNDIGVFQSSRQNRFGQKLVPNRLLFAGMPVDGLQRHFATKRNLPRQMNRAHAPFTQQ